MLLMCVWGKFFFVQFKFNWGDTNSKTLCVQ